MKFLTRITIPDLLLELSPLILGAIVGVFKIKQNYEYFMGRVILTGLKPSANQVGTMETIANVEMVRGRGLYI